jgi:hypothetical protein
MTEHQPSALQKASDEALFELELARTRFERDFKAELDLIHGLHQYNVTHKYIYPFDCVIVLHPIYHIQNRCFLEIPDCRLCGKALI